MSAIDAEYEVGERAGSRAVAMPGEHGGWGLTLEPVLLGMLVAWSAAGVVLGIAAFTAFLLRSPGKLIAVDIRALAMIADRLGLRQMAIGVALVAVTAVGVLW